jgi:hypothetical protein
VPRTDGNDEQQRPQDPTGGHGARRAVR